MFFMPIKINGALKMFLNVSSKIMLKSCMWYVNQTRTRWGAGICLGDGGSHSALCPLPMWRGQMTVSNMPGFLTGEMKMLLPSSQLGEDTDEMVLVGEPGAAAHTWPTSGPWSAFVDEVEWNHQGAHHVQVCVTTSTWRWQSWVVVPEMIQKDDDPKDDLKYFLSGPL